ncbi:cytochrome-c peroxidase [Amantichitinum ursilacus]|uniref:Cytochrome c551 peroxidase n=1 Tax=Amantichitinum ursilacus TaxID=857265 RepID=A0A0N0GNK7_9NEIS|nr:cytochrome-c peroxidase [Amantichitinum ursilacus]KPC52633.1 Cytochrome c551 peroxidase precursor [Amantichitinum ursilacus]
MLFDRSTFRTLAACLLAGAVLHQAGATGAPATPDPALRKQAQTLFKPIIATPNPDPTGRIALGKMLFFDARLSRSGTQSCSSCHNLARAGVDNTPVSLGHRWTKGTRNSPTVLNATYHSKQFWDGRAVTLEDQAKGPITNPVEMALADPATAVRRLNSIPGYPPLFAKAFPDSKSPLSYDNIASAIASFERTLVTPSRFDQYLTSNPAALTDTEQTGLRRFMETGCIACHSGVALGGTQFMKFGLAKGPYWKYTGSKGRDHGVAEVSKKAADTDLFKVPGLRNVAQTAPYFHDGSVWSLRDAIRIMGETQLGTTLTATDLDTIEAFLTSLNGEVPRAARELPQLPPDGPSTPKPDFN